MVKKKWFIKSTTWFW